VNVPIHIADSILTAYLRAAAAKDGIALTGNRDGFALIDAAQLGAVADHLIHPDVGIALRDKGVVALQSAMRADELAQPTIWLRTSGPTSELLARATMAPYFGFRPRAWVKQAGAHVDAVVCG
jgi:hypothetical protein